jgi:hypothetical protein
MKKLLLATAAFIVLSVPSDAATVSSYINKEGKGVITLDGDLVEGDSKKVGDEIGKHNKAGRWVIAIRLNSLGGLMSEGIIIGEGVKEAHISTVVPNGSVCASACFIIFAGGTEKYASGKSSIGVHGAADKNGAETVDTAAATVVMARVLKELGAPPSIIGKMVVTPPSEMLWLKLEDMQSMGVNVTGMNK